MKRIELSASRKGIPALRCRYHATPPCPRLLLISASRYMLARIGIMSRKLQRRIEAPNHPSQAYGIHHPVNRRKGQKYKEEFNDRNILERRAHPADRDPPEDQREDEQRYDVGAELFPAGRRLTILPASPVKLGFVLARAHRAASRGGAFVPGRDVKPSGRSPIGVILIAMRSPLSNPARDGPMPIMRFCQLLVTEIR